MNPKLIGGLTLLLTPVFLLIAYNRDTLTRPADFRDAVVDSLKGSNDSIEAPAATPVAAKDEKTWKFPYKTIAVKCSGGGQKIELHWDLSVSPMVTSVLVNGSEESPGMKLVFEKRMSEYSKEGVFRIVFAFPDRDKDNFPAIASVGSGPELKMACSKTSSWHMTK